MIKDLKKLIYHSSIYTIGNIADKIVGIILLPLYTSLITTSNYGVYSGFQATIQLAQGLFLFGSIHIILRWMNLAETKNEKGEILFNIYFIIFISLSFVVGIILAFNNSLNDLIFKEQNYSLIFIVSALILIISTLNRLYLTLLRYKERAVIFIVISLVRLLLQFSVTYYLVAYKNYDILGIFVGILASQLITFVSLTPFYLKECRFKLRISLIKEMLHFGIPLTFSSFSSKFLDIGDRYLIGIFGNSALLGVYSLGYKIGNLMKSLVINSFNTAFLPQAWKKINDKDSNEYYKKIMTYFTCFTVWICLALSIFSNEIIQLFAKNENYWGAAKIIPFVAIALCFRGMFDIVKISLQYVKKTKIIAYIIISAAILNIILNLITIPLYGIIGAAFSTLISFVFIFILGYWSAKKFYDIRIEWFRISKVFLSYLLIYSFTYQFDYNLIGFLAKFGLLFFYPFLLYIFKFFNNEEIAFFKKLKWKTFKKK